MSQQYQPVLNLKKRPCKIGGSMSTTTEKHGDEDVGAINIAVDGITITRDELEALLGPGSFDAIYEIDEDTEVEEIRMPWLKPMAFRDHFEKARVEFWLGLDNHELKFSGCKVRNVSLKPQVGGMTLLKCSVYAAAEDGEVAVLYHHLNSEGAIAIRHGKKAESKDDRQQELGLSEKSDDAGEGE